MRHSSLRKNNGPGEAAYSRNFTVNKDGQKRAEQISRTLKGPPNRKALEHEQPVQRSRIRQSWRSHAIQRPPMPIPLVQRLSTLRVSPSNRKLNTSPTNRKLNSQPPGNKTTEIQHLSQTVEVVPTTEAYKRNKETRTYTDIVKAQVKKRQLENARRRPPAPTFLISNAGKKSLV